MYVICFFRAPKGTVLEGPLALLAPKGLLAQDLRGAQEPQDPRVHLALQDPLPFQDPIGNVSRYLILSQLLIANGPALGLKNKLCANIPALALGLFHFQRLVFLGHRGRQDHQELQAPVMHHLLG